MKRMGESQLQRKPIQYAAKDIKTGKYVTGWYVELHLSDFDYTTGEDRGTFTLHHCLFNDQPRDPKKGYWTDIDPTTLRPVEQEQTLF